MRQEVVTLVAGTDVGVRNVDSGKKIIELRNPGEVLNLVE